MGLITLLPQGLSVSDTEVRGVLHSRKDPLNAFSWLVGILTPFLLGQEAPCEVRITHSGLSYSSVSEDKPRPPAPPLFLFQEENPWPQVTILYSAL